MDRESIRNIGARAEVVIGTFGLTATAFTAADTEPIRKATESFSGSIGSYLNVMADAGIQPAVALGALGVLFGAAIVHGIHALRR